MGKTDTNIIYDVDLALDIKSFIINNLDVVEFSNPTLKDKILNSGDDILLRIGKTINSLTKIVSVDVVDANFFKENLFKDSNGD
jgi:hypothetical protein